MNENKHIRALAKKIAELTKAAKGTTSARQASRSIVSVAGEDKPLSDIAGDAVHAAELAVEHEVKVVGQQDQLLDQSLELIGVGESFDSQADLIAEHSTDIALEGEERQELFVDVQEVDTSRYEDREENASTADIAFDVFERVDAVEVEAALADDRLNDFAEEMSAVMEENDKTLETANEAVREAGEAVEEALTAAGIADNALSTASGKNKIVNSTDDPVDPGEAEGDIFRKWDKLTVGRKLLASWSWDGAEWVEDSMDPTYLPLVDIGQGTFGELAGERLVAGSVLADQIGAEAVTAEAIAAGAVVAEKIASNAVTADKVNAQSVAAELGEFIEVRASKVIGDTGAMNSAFIGQLVGDDAFLGSLYTNKVIVDAQDFAPGPGGYSSAYELGTDAFYTSNNNDPTGGAIFIRTTGSPASARMAWGPSTPINEGEWITWESLTSPNVTGANGPTGTNWSTCVYWYQSDGTEASTTRTFITNETRSGGTAGWSRGTVQAPPGTAYARVRFYSTSGSTGSWYFRNFKIRKQVGAVLIEDGAVVAEKLAAGSVTANALSVDALDFKSATGLSVYGGHIQGAYIEGGEFSLSAVDSGDVEDHWVADVQSLRGLYWYGYEGTVSLTPYPYEGEYSIRLSTDTVEPVPYLVFNDTLNYRITPASRAFYFYVFSPQATNIEIHYGLNYRHPTSPDQVVVVSAPVPANVWHRIDAPLGAQADMDKLVRYFWLEVPVKDTPYVLLGKAAIEVAAEDPTRGTVNIVRDSDGIPGITTTGYDGVIEGRSYLGSSHLTLFNTPAGDASRLHMESSIFGPLISFVHNDVAAAMRILPEGLLIGTSGDHVRIDSDLRVDGDIVDSNGRPHLGRHIRENASGRVYLVGAGGGSWTDSYLGVEAGGASGRGFWYGHENTIRFLVYPSGDAKIYGDLEVVGRIDNSHTPFAMASGWVTILPSGANVTTSASVTFPAGRFTNVNKLSVTVSPQSSAGALLRDGGVGYTNRSTSGVTINMSRSNTISTVVSWQAVQMEA